MSDTNPNPEPISVPGKPVWFAVAAAVLAWPLGKLIAEALSIGQDGPGIAIAAMIGTVAMIAVWAVAFFAITAMCWGKMAGFEVRTRLAIVAAVLLVPVSLVVSAVPSQDYALRVVNDSGADIQDVVVTFNEHRFSYGAVMKKTYAVRSFVATPPKGLAIVSWTDDRGHSREAELNISSKVPVRYNNGVLTIRFKEEGIVTASFFVRRSP